MLILLQNGEYEIVIVPRSILLDLRMESIQPAANRIQTITFDIGLEQFIYIDNRSFTVDDNVSLTDDLDFFLLIGIKFVTNFSNDFFQYIFDRKHTGRPAVLIN